MQCFVLFFCLPSVLRHSTKTLGLSLIAVQVTVKFSLGGTAYSLSSVSGNGLSDNSTSADVPDDK